MMRFCACPCKRPLTGRRPNARYATAACRTRHWKERRGIIGLRYVKASQNGKSGPPGLQVSYRKAVLALALDYQREGKPWYAAVPQAERVLQQALPVRQRAQLHAREQRRAA